MESYHSLHSKYKNLLHQAYQLSKTDKDASNQAYAEADRLRQELFAV